MHTTTCQNCNNDFERHDDWTGKPGECYGCALKRFSGNSCPEEGDFNSARLASGQMSEAEYRDLLEDLRSVEEGRSIREPYYDEAEDETDYCDDCGWAWESCQCPPPDYDDEE